MNNAWAATWYRYPYVTGTSVVGIKYKDGILLAGDMGGEVLIHLFEAIYAFDNPASHSSGVDLSPLEHIDIYHCLYYYSQEIFEGASWRETSVLSLHVDSNLFCLNV